MIISRQKQSFGEAPQKIANGSELLQIRTAIREAVHDFKPLADIAKEVVQQVPHGTGRRIKEILKRLYDPKSQNPFKIRHDIDSLIIQQRIHLRKTPDGENYLYNSFNPRIKIILEGVKKYGNN